MRIIRRLDDRKQLNLSFASSNEKPAKGGWEVGIVHIVLLNNEHVNGRFRRHRTCPRLPKRKKKEKIRKPGFPLFFLWG